MFPLRCYFSKVVLRVRTFQNAVFIKITLFRPTAPICQVILYTASFVKTLLSVYSLSGETKRMDIDRIFRNSLSQAFYPFKRDGEFTKSTASLVAESVKVDK
jgi:hypothetical protein